MKKAVGHLIPYIEEEKARAGGDQSVQSNAGAPRASSALPPHARPLALRRRVVPVLVANVASFSAMRAYAMSTSIMACQVGFRQQSADMGRMLLALTQASS